MTTPLSPNQRSVQLLKAQDSVGLGPSQGQSATGERVGSCTIKPTRLNMPIAADVSQEHAVSGEKKPHMVGGVRVTEEDFAKITGQGNGSTDAGDSQADDESVKCMVGGKPVPKKNFDALAALYGLAYPQNHSELCTPRSSDKDYTDRLENMHLKNPVKDISSGELSDFAVRAGPMLNKAATSSNEDARSRQDQAVTSSNQGNNPLDVDALFQDMQTDTRERLARLRAKPEGT